MALALCAVLVPPTCAKSIRITDFNLSVFSDDSISVSLSDKAPLLSYFVIIPRARMRSELRVIVVGRSVCGFLCTHVFSRTVAAVDTKRGYLGMCNSKSLERRSQRTACLRGEAKIYTDV